VSISSVFLTYVYCDALFREGKVRQAMCV